jgi:hypothetical protein
MIFRKKNEKNDYWDILKAAEKELISWDSSRTINIYRIEYVAVFEEWSDGIELYIFYKTEKEKITVLKEGYFDELKIITSNYSKNTTIHLFYIQRSILSLTPMKM